MKPLNILLFYALDENWSTLSYAKSLPGAILRHSAFDVTAVNLSKMSALDRLNVRLNFLFTKIDAVFVMHSVYSNACYMTDGLAARIAGQRRPVVYFVGNEYKSMPEKLHLAECLEVSLLVSQINSKIVHRLYEERLRCRAIFVPNAVANPEEFPPGPSLEHRPLDIGYRAFEGAKYLGHQDRRRIAELVQPHAEARGLSCDLSLDPSQRLAGADWLQFLQNSKAQLAVEAGTDYFDLDDRFRLKGNQLETASSDISFDRYSSVVFDPASPKISGRTITSRHLECAMTKTPLIMFDGEYCGAFAAGMHYIPLARDGSDVEDALDRFADRGYCARVADAAFAAAAERFGKARLMRELESEVRGLVA